MPHPPQAERIAQVLVIQPAFIGDAILASGLLETWHQAHPHTQLDLLVRKGNEQLYTEHPYLRNVLVWDKQGGKYRQLWRLLKSIRETKYDLIVNPHRFASSGLLAAFGGANYSVGFKKNPLSRWFSARYAHHISAAPNGLHEVDRNHKLIANWCANKAQPKLYPSDTNLQHISHLSVNTFSVLAPGSVWATKQLPLEHWQDLQARFPEEYTLYCVGAPSDSAICEQIAQRRPNTFNLAGKLQLLDTAALLQHADRLYTNDSAPLHLASAVGCPTTAFFCSTVPAFGFGPLATDSEVIEHPGELACRPCGLHGKSACPEGHFKCGHSIDVTQATLATQHDSR